MFKQLRVAAPIAVAAITLMALLPGIASAHEKRQVGNFTFVVGFLNEPAIVDQPNSIDLTITDANSQPVNGADKTLKAQIIFGGSTEDMTLTPRFNAPGKYNGEFIPTKAGTWKFHFTGAVSGQNVDETFTSGPGRFSDVATSDSLDFPAKTGDLLTMNAQTTAAKSAAANAKTMALAAIVVGAVGVVLGIAGFGYGMSVRRKQAEAASGGASLPRTA